jgi:membrane protein DedA with SNARE-associated domain
MNRSMPVAKKPAFTAAAVGAVVLFWIGMALRGKRLERRRGSSR